MTKATFMGGTLSFKGDSKSNDKIGKRKRRKTKLSAGSTDKETKQEKSELVAATNDNNDEGVGASNNFMSDLTDAERKAMKRKLERETAELAKVAMKSHRERVEEFNEKLSSQTEHNDIPRVRICYKAVDEIGIYCLLLVVIIIDFFAFVVVLDDDVDRKLFWKILKFVTHICSGFPSILS
jgi:protein FAM32A